MFRDHLENSARDLESPLGRLVWVGRCADHYRFALEKREMPVASVTKRAAQNIGRVVLDENGSFKREPGRKIRERFAECFAHFVVIRSALHNVAVRIPGVAIGAAESASDVRVDG